MPYNPTTVTEIDDYLKGFPNYKPTFDVVIMDYASLYPSVYPKLLPNYGRLSKIRKIIDSIEKTT